MSKKAQVEVTAPNLYRNGTRCAIGQKFSVTLDAKGEVPMIYRGKVRILGESMEVATPDAKANETGNGGKSEDTSADADEQRKNFLLDEIEKLTGKRPGANSKLETLEEKFKAAKLNENE